jgi:hypothetical protein
MVATVGLSGLADGHGCVGVTERWSIDCQGRLCEGVEGTGTETKTRGVGATMDRTRTRNDRDGRQGDSGCAEQE